MHFSTFFYYAIAINAASTSDLLNNCQKTHKPNGDDHKTTRVLSIYRWIGTKCIIIIIYAQSWAAALCVSITSPNNSLGIREENPPIRPTTRSIERQRELSHRICPAAQNSSSFSLCATTKIQFNFGHSAQNGPMPCDFCCIGSLLGLLMVKTTTTTIKSEFVCSQ